MQRKRWIRQAILDSLVFIRLAGGYYISGGRQMGRQT